LNIRLQLAMSSLVDYGSSDESENDSKPVIKYELPVPKEIENNGNSRPASQDENPNLGLFSSLPPPKQSFTLDADDGGLIVNRYKHPKRKEPVKITVPSLSEVNLNINYKIF
jgi:hypothetical protein